MITPFPEMALIDFGEVKPEIDTLLQQGVAAYRSDFDAADALFRRAAAEAPEQLPSYYCLYKIHTYRGHLDEARRFAGEGLAEAARQAGWPGDWRQWTPHDPIPDGAGRFALYTLKALAFIHLRRDEPQQASEKIEALKILDPTGAVGWPVIAELLAGVLA
jgi:tetratricopeptide (TPR) repeat protein